MPEPFPSDRDKILDRAVIGAAGLLVVVAGLGFAFGPYLVVEHPLLLLLLAPWPRHMILAAPQLDFWPFMVVATLRAYASCAIGFAVGARFGAARVVFLQKRGKRSAKLLAIFMDVFSRVGHLLVLFIPGPMSGSVAAISGMRARVALPLLFIGQAAWVYVNFRLGHALKEWTLPLMELIRTYMWQATLVCTLAAAIYEWNRRRRARSSENTAS